MTIYYIIIGIALLYYAWYAYTFLYLAPKRKETAEMPSRSVTKSVSHPDEKNLEGNSENIRKKNIFAQVTIAPVSTSPSKKEKEKIQEGEKSRGEPSVIEPPVTMSEGVVDPDIEKQEEGLPEVTKEEMEALTDNEFTDEDLVDEINYEDDIPFTVGETSIEEDPPSDIDFGFEPYQEDPPNPNKNKKGFDKADDSNDINLDDYFN